jgi:hypothetical protein
MWWAWLRLGFWWGSIQAGGVQCGIPLIMVQVQPRWWCSRWWWPHRRVRLSRSVRPRSAQAVMWWAWVQAAGAVQAGNVQPRSRAARARRGGR